MLPIYIIIVSIFVTGTVSLVQKQPCALKNMYWSINECNQNRIIVQNQCRNTNPYHLHAIHPET